MRKKKLLYFTTLSSLVIFIFLELSSNLILKIFYTPNVLLNEHGEYDLGLDINPFMEPDKDLKYHIRRDPFTKKTKAYPVTLESGNKVPGIISYDFKEGIVRNSRGDTLINKWGFRGPYVEKEKPDFIYRIATLGGSTTAGKHENAQTYPRLLERMLNGQDNGLTYQVLNFGVWGYDSCDLKTIYKNEVVGFDPDMIIIMSGWNDITKQGSKRIKSINDYCKNNYSVLSNSNTYRLLKFWLKSFTEEKTIPYELLENSGQNSIYYLQNMRAIIADAKKRNILVGMINLPALIETKTPNEMLKKMPQVRNLSIEHLDFMLTLGIKMNELIEKVSSEFENAFHVHHSISFGSEFKPLFFSDEIHPTGAGNRLIAFNVMEKINSLNAKDKKLIENQKNKSFNKNELEIEYLKSLLSSFTIEDLSFTTCMVLYRRCTFVVGLAGAEYATSVTEFSLGVLLNFAESLAHPEIHDLIEKSLQQSIEILPDFSPPYWVLSQFYYATGEKKAGNLWLKKAQTINPLFDDPLFHQSIREYRKNIKNNKLLRSLPDFLNAFVSKPPMGVYKLFSLLKEPLTIEKSPSKILQKYLNAYYLNPLLIRSIFENSTQYFISVREYKIALDLIKKIKLIKPEYDFKKIFSDYENEINKMKLISAN
jgi:lysophospholipase L1-like esterase